MNVKRNVYRSLLCAAVLSALVVGSASTSASNDTARATSQRVYTAAEARRGEALYATNCAVCHRDDMGGKDPAPELAGETFMSKWSGKSVGELLTRTRTTMPFGKPDSLTVREYLDILALLLEANDFPAGNEPLPEAAEQLNSIKID